ncbi:TPA: hypothetical protein N0F65_006580, partial [Lagenidium giganteum]
AFILRFERQYDIRVKVIRSNNEINTRELRAWCQQHGIRQQLTEPNESASNGKIERRHRTIFDGVRAMMFSAPNAPRFLWSEAAKHQSWLRNRLPTRSNTDRKSPMEVLTGAKPDLAAVLEWGGPVTTHVKERTMGIRKKAEHGLAMRPTPLGETKQKEDSIVDAYWQLSQSPVIRKYLMSLPTAPHTKQDVDDEPPADDDEGANCDSDDDPVADDDDSVADPSETAMDKWDEHDDQGASLAERRTCRTIQRPQRFEDGAAFIITRVAEPKSVREAMDSPFRQQWIDAIRAELDALVENGTWEVVEQPASSNVVDCKWVLKIKYDSAGEIGRFKARLVARGFSQKYGVDYSATFAPVIRMSSVRLFFVLIAILHLEQRQGDVPNAYVKGALKEYILMKSPKELNLRSGHVLRLLKPLYGLKQSGRCWNEAMDQFIKDIGFMQSQLDPCIYFKNSGTSVTLLGL